MTTIQSNCLKKDKIMRFIIIFFIVFLLQSNTILLANQIKSLSQENLKKTRETYLGKTIPHCLDIEPKLMQISISYYSMDNKVKQDGLIIVHKVVAKRVAKIFEELLATKFNIFGIDPFKGFIIKNNEIIVDDNYNYSGSYACRNMVGKAVPSRHSLGLAIDINPLFNPFLQINAQTKAIENIVPKDGIFYLNRDTIRPNKPARFGIITKDIVKIFAQNGFTTWGGYWDFPLDYHHFELSANLSGLLVSMSDEDAEKLFEMHIDYFNKNNDVSADKIPAGRELITAILNHFNTDDITKAIDTYKKNPKQFMLDISKIY
jgi:hypothetical protein